MAGKARLEGRNLNIALKMLERITTVLENQRVSYWLEAGTLLGIIRENRLLPWDNDLDVSILESDVDKLKTALIKFRLLGYVVRKRKYNYNVTPFSRGEIRIVKIWNRKVTLARGGVLLDIFVKVKEKDRYYWAIGSKNYTIKSAPAHFYEKLTTINFNNKLYSVPADYDGYLTFRYKNWKIPVKNYNTFQDDRAIVD